VKTTVREPKKMMILDNPDTMLREGSVNGVVVMHVSAQLLMELEPRGHPRLPWQLNVGPWNTGQKIEWEA
jgi:hypothetical protein